MCSVEVLDGFQRGLPTPRRATGVQRLVGEAERFEVDHQGCGSWMPQEFRLCASPLKGRSHEIVLRSGEFYSQPFVEDSAVSAAGGRCKQGAFFHMQEWKKRWADGGAGHIDPRAAYDTFRVSQDGIHALALPK